MGNLGTTRLAVILVLLLSTSVNAQTDTSSAFRPLTQEMLNNPDPQDWLMWRGGYENWGYSALDQINQENVGELQLVWSWAFPAAPGSNGMQVEPMVYDGVLYVRHSNERYSAHDAATGDMLWEYSRPLPIATKNW